VGGTKTYTIDKGFAVLMRAAPWIFAAFVALATALPFLPDDGRPRNPAAVLGLSAFCILFFGALGWWSWRIARRWPHYAIAVDEDGLWPAHLSKERALIRWAQTHDVKERPFLQRLDVLDVEGNVLLQLEYQLHDFESLRALLLQKLPTRATPSLPATYRKARIYHVFHIAGLLGFSLLGLFVGETNPLLGYGGMGVLVAAILFEFLKTPSQLSISQSQLQITYPLRTLTFYPAQISAVRLGDSFHEGARLPQVGVFIHGQEKPIRLLGLGVDAVQLQRTLEQWRSQPR